MIDKEFRRTVGLAAALTGAMICAPYPATADAIITLTGPPSNAGTIDLSAADDQFGGLVTVGGVTGYSVWGLLGTRSQPRLRRATTARTRFCAITCSPPAPTAAN